MSDDLREKYRLLGFDDEAAAFAADQGSAADLAGAALLRLCWATIDEWAQPGALGGFSSAQQLASSGASVEDLRQLARGVAYSTIFRVLYLLDEGPNYALRDLIKVWEPGFPNWGLTVLDDNNEAAGWMGGLHEGLLSSDPSGREGADLF